MNAYLVLENGSVYEGKSFGSIQNTSGEVGKKLLNNKNRVKLKIYLILIIQK